MNGRRIAWVVIFVVDAAYISLSAGAAIAPERSWPPRSALESEGTLLSREGCEVVQSRLVYLHDERFVLVDLQAAVGGPPPARVVRSWLLSGSLFQAGRARAEGPG